MLDFTIKQKIISDFLADVYIASDSNELDKWLAFLARENGDEPLANRIGGNEC